ncbi:MAG TPA: Spy/CpxP family protein refolding chaperone [Gemmatimonadaceae bacterium]|jgi:Spy/CpxP family protein refolding chaperone|nr:Spy/CpxP family protein refolding chaperone [Gemmatimonadaceae bacterium]
MSIVRTLAVSALMVVGVAGVSAAQSATAPRTRADSGSFRRAEGFRRGREGFAFGRDLNLTDAQKAQIKAIRQKYQPQDKALRTQAKPYMDAARAARQKGDTAAFRTNMQKARQVMQGGQSFRTQEMNEIRGVLTPAQQAKWDANQKSAADRRAKRGEKGWGHKKAADKQ